MPKAKFIWRTRDAETGRFVPDGTEKIRPDTTVRVRLRVPRPSK